MKRPKINEKEAENGPFQKCFQMSTTKPFLLIVKIQRYSLFFSFRETHRDTFCIRICIGKIFSVLNFYLSLLLRLFIHFAHSIQDETFFELSNVVLNISRIVFEQCVVTAKWWQVFWIAPFMALTWLEKSHTKTIKLFHFLETIFWFLLSNFIVFMGSRDKLGEISPLWQIGIKPTLVNFLCFGQMSLLSMAKYWINSIAIWLHYLQSCCCDVCKIKTLVHNWNLVIADQSKFI